MFNALERYIVDLNAELHFKGTNKNIKFLKEEVFSIIILIPL